MCKGKISAVGNAHFYEYNVLIYVLELCSSCVDLCQSTAQLVVIPRLYLHKIWLFFSKFIHFVYQMSTSNSAFMWCVISKIMDLFFSHLEAYWVYNVPYVYILIDIQRMMWSVSCHLLLFPKTFFDTQGHFFSTKPPTLWDTPTHDNQAGSQVCLPLSYRQCV